TEINLILQKMPHPISPHITLNYPLTPTTSPISFTQLPPMPFSSNLSTPPTIKSSFLLTPSLFLFPIIPLST
ncbi:hypothetical protein, partial [Neisseria sicca]|uniref:hypothetical protein n=1 Tax=Neisseria sicca TaxID=490 RepID=UPI001C9A1252